MTADNDIVERLREGARDASGRDMADHASTWGSLTCADLREAAAEIVRLRGEVGSQDDEYLAAMDKLHFYLAGNSDHPLYREFLRFVNTARVAPAEAKGEAVAWRNPTPYGVGYSFASEEVMHDLVGYVAESFDAPPPTAPAGMDSASLNRIIPPPAKHPKPDENGNDTGPCCAHAYADGWNACRDAMLAASAKPQGGEVEGG